MRGWSAALAAAALAGCGSSASDYTPRISVLEPSRKPEATATVARAEVVKRPVALVTALELGRMGRGRLLTAYGDAPAGGWFQPELRPLREGAPAPDGFLEYEFMAAPPDLNGGVGQPGLPVEQRRLRADLTIPDAVAAQAAGVRVFGVKETPLALRFETGG